MGIHGAPVTAPGQPEAARRGARGGRVLRVHERSEARDGREARLRGRRGAVGETAGGGQLRDERCDLPRRRARRLVPPTRAAWRVRLHGAGAEQRLCLGRPAGVVAGSRHCSGGGRGGRRRFERAGERGQLGAGGAQHRLARHAAGGHARSQQLHVLRDLLRELLQPAHERRLPRLTLGQPVQRLEEIIVDASVADAVDGVQVAAQLEGAQLRRHVVDEELQVHGVRHRRALRLVRREQRARARQRRLAVRCAPIERAGGEVLQVAVVRVLTRLRGVLGVVGQLPLPLLFHEGGDLRRQGGHAEAGATWVFREENANKYSRAAVH